MFNYLEKVEKKNFCTEILCILTDKPNDQSQHALL